LDTELNIITGHTGFVGINLSAYFKKINKKLLGVSRKPAGNEISYLELNSTILNSSISCIHLAGKAHDLKNTSENNEYYEVNTDLTKRIFDLFLESDCKTFIYMSSVKAVADSVEGILIEEEVPNPITVYGKSKLAAEKYILSKEIPKGKRVYILRPCMIHGPNNNGNLNLLFSFVSRGIPYPFGKYHNKRSFVSVENLCFVINELLDNTKIASGIYNIADDASLSTIELVTLMGNLLHKPLRILNLPKTIVKVLAKIGDVLPIPIDSDRLQKLTENYKVSNAKIKKAIQKELPLSAKEGIQKTIGSF
jgi:nucleoside-diphosphate-sugar epimerase